MVDDDGECEVSRRCRVRVHTTEHILALSRSSAAAADDLYCTFIAAVSRWSGRQVTDV